ncbi:hypothetical protein BpHYR1_013696 [Brachionus plicatilis]|uniref:Uncharacterized protein n=1 Tax=Brachionus plicatilis TaxID=10195 RepID=A0A3M7RTV9_BRAPC|nr:hypothetical protein BpHYR1_013696 [Brachionus plicatilis]
MQRHNLEHIIGAGAILNLAHVKFNLTCVACAKTLYKITHGKNFFSSTLPFPTGIVEEESRNKMRTINNLDLN